MRTLVLAALAASLFCATAHAAAVLKPRAVLRVTGGHFVAAKDKAAQDISGLACLAPTANGARTCVVVDDQDAHSQALNLSGSTITPKTRIPLAEGSTVGSPPTAHACPLGIGKFGERDGEAVAFDGTYFYVVGSHGCGRKGQKYKASSLKLARFKLGADGKAQQLQNSYRLSEVLSASAQGGTFLRDLNTKDGLNIEGFAVQDGRAYVGLRAPRQTGPSALTLLKIPAVADLFSADAKLAAETLTIPIAGQDLGVRDLAPFGAGRLLVLFGPAQNQPLAYRLGVYDLRAGCLAELGALEPVTGVEGAAKAEAVWPLGERMSDGVLVMFDGVADGGARLYVPTATGTCTR